MTYNRMKVEYKPVSLADQVHEKLESEILSGKYKRGEFVTELQLSSELGVSRTPVREALRRLASERLVEETPRGTMILGVVRKDFEDMSAIRLRIEGLAVRGFIDNLSEESLRELREAVELQEFYLNKSDPDHIRAQDSRFHEVIYNYCGSTIFADTLTPLHKKVQKYRRQSIETGNRAEVSVSEHRKIYEAIEKKDKDEAERLMNAHIRNALTIIMDKGM
ncbi:MAG: GntR family transcriptional regulator [Clostridia bacterium]|nr:GntR family transcriptional regulator [Clostridia bacterium]